MPLLNILVATGRDKALPNPNMSCFVQEMTRCLTPLLNILAATGRNTDTVMQEVGLMRAGWLACDYRAWLKAYNPDFKRPKLASGTATPATSIPQHASVLNGMSRVTLLDSLTARQSPANPFLDGPEVTERIGGCWSV